MIDRRHHDPHHPDPTVRPLPVARIWICATCGNHYPGSVSPPPVCEICADERQWLPPTGQSWTTLPELAEAGYHSEIRELEPGMTGFGVEPLLGVGQRGILVETSKGNILWDPPGYLDDRAVAEIRQRGGVDVLTASHPHFYGSIIECSHLFDAEVVLPKADLHWLTRPEGSVRTWSGTANLLPGVTLIECGGHFAGSSVLHWLDGAEGEGVLLAGDTVIVTPDESRVTFAWSAPNRIPLPERGVNGIVESLRPYRFERIYSGWWNPVVRHDGHRALETSAKRYIDFLRGDVVL